MKFHKGGVVIIKLTKQRGDKKKIEKRRGELGKATAVVGPIFLRPFKPLFQGISGGAAVDSPPFFGQFFQNIFIVFWSEF